MPLGVDAEHALHLLDQLAQPQPAARRRRLLGAAVGKHAFGIGDGAVERAQQLRREGLHGRILDQAQAVRHQLRRGQDVAHVVVDLGDGQAEIGKVLLLAEHALQLRLHVRRARARRRRSRRCGRRDATMLPGSSGAAEKVSIERVMSRIGRIMIRPWIAAKTSWR